MLRIGMLGECMIELNGEPFNSIKQSFGGDTLNAAVYLSRCIKDNSKNPNIKVYYVTAVGNDLLSEKLVDKWVQEGIDTQYVFKSERHHCGLYFIQLDENGERSFQYWRNDSAARYLFSEFNQEEIFESLCDLDYLLLSGISLAILPNEDKGKLIELLHRLKSCDVKIIFDGNFRPKLWSNLTEISIKEWYENIYKISDMVLVTDEDEFALFGNSSHEDLVTRLHQYGIPIVVVKLGAQGCLLSENGREKILVPTDKIDFVVDTTSAGDSFNAGFIYCLLTGGSLVDACKFGHFVAGHVIRHHGAIIDPNVKFHKNKD